MNCAAVYVVTHLPTGRVYVGKTCRKDGRFEDRWTEHIRLALKGSKTYFHSAIRRHGHESFQFKVLDRCPTSFANTLERLWIILLRANVKGIGFNTTSGGDGGKPSEDVIEKMRAVKLGRKNGPHSAERIEKIRNSKIGKPRDAATILKMTAARQKFKELPTEWRKNISEGLRAIAKFKLTEEQKQEILKSQLPSTHLAAVYGVHSSTI